MKTIVAILCIVCYSSLALAGEPPIDTITLSDGTILRGHATEIRPGDHLEMVLLDGRTETLAWSQIVASDGPSFPFDPVAAFLTPGTGRVALQVTSPVSARIAVSARPELGLPCVPVCSFTPCTIYVPPGQIRLEVSGDNVVPYATQLAVPANGGTLTIKPANLAEQSAGVRLIIASVPLTIVGAVLAGVGTTLDHQPSFNTMGKVSYNDYSAPVEGVGGTLAGIGVGALVSGIVLLAKSHSGSDSMQPLDGSIHF